jgi:hypothetical protein
MVWLVEADRVEVGDKVEDEKTSEMKKMLLSGNPSVSLARGFRSANQGAVDIDAALRAA